MEEFNDGETEIEELTDDIRKAIERDEIGVPGELYSDCFHTLLTSPVLVDSCATLKPVPKRQHAQPACPARDRDSFKQVCYFYSVPIES
jgi:hypothetical protein